MSGKIYMLNAVWYKPDGGAKTYRKYLRAAMPLIEGVGGRKLRSLVPGRALQGEFDADLIFFVEYPNWGAFKEFSTGPELHKIAYLRERALEKSILVRCERPSRREN